MLPRNGNPHTASYTPCDLRSRFSVDIAAVGRVRTVKVVGDIDVATRSTLHAACTADDGCDVMVDLRATTFIDCGGYGALVAARRDLEARGGSLSWFGPSGQPQRFLQLLGALEPTPAWGSVS